MSARQANFLRQLGAIFILFGLFWFSGVGAGTVTHTATSGNAAPQVSNLKVNDNLPIVLTANTSTNVYVSFTITDSNGCSDVFPSGTVTSTLYRTSQAGEGNCSFSYSSCYIQSTTTYSCAGGSSTSANATTTFFVYYFADATDASSSYPSSTWGAQIQVKDFGGATTTTSTVGVELNTLTAIAAATSTLDYGTVSAGGNTGSTNQELQVINVGNSSSSLQVNGTGMTSGSYVNPTSSQHYATGTFTYGGAEQLLQSAATAISGWLTNHGPNIRSWQNTTALPISVRNSSGVVYGGYLYNFGGTGAGSVSSVYLSKINATGSIGSWSTTTALSNSGYDFAIIANNGFMYYLGGNQETTTVKFSTINSTGSLGTWQTTTPLPSAISSLSAAINNNYIYSMGGYKIPLATSTVLFAPVNSTGSIGAWATTTPLPVGLSSHKTIFANGYVYVLGGGATTSVFYAPVNSTGSIGAWATTTPLTYLIDGVAINSDNNSIYVTGGSYGCSAEATTTNIFTKMNLNGSLGPWQNTMPFISPLGCQATAISRGYIYFISGYDNVSPPAGNTSTVSYARLSSQNLYWGLSMTSSLPADLNFNGVNTLTAVFAP